MQRRHPPLRLCLGCGQQRPKRELLRVVRTPEGEVRLDPGGKLNGRGAYVCPDKECLQKALRSQRLGRALDVEVPAETVALLAAQLGVST